MRHVVLGCLRSQVNSPLPEAVTQTCGDIFVKQVVFLTVNHRGPLPVRELHSTDETSVWRDPGGSWACLRPARDYEWIHSARGCDTDLQRHLCKTGTFSYGSLPLREIHPADETRVWRDPKGSRACLQPVYVHKWIHPVRSCGTHDLPVNQYYTRGRNATCGVRVH